MAPICKLPFCSPRMPDKIGVGRESVEKWDPLQSATKRAARATRMPSSEREQPGSSSESGSPSEPLRRISSEFIRKFVEGTGELG